MEFQVGRCFYAYFEGYLKSYIRSEGLTDFMAVHKTSKVVLLILRQSIKRVRILTMQMKPGMHSERVLRVQFSQIVSVSVSYAYYFSK